MRYNEIPGYCDYHDFYRDVFDGLPDGAIIAEVGVYLGHSVAMMSTLAKEAKKNVTIYAIDTFEGSLEHRAKGRTDFGEAFMRNISACGVSDYVVTMTGKSLWAAQTIANTFDFVFIDASHDYDNVKADILAWSPKVKPGGILAGHDMTPVWPGVVKAVNEIFPNANVKKNVWWTRIEPTS